MPEKKMNTDLQQSINAFAGNEAKEDSEFYIGWMPKSPDGFAKQVRKTVVVLTLVVIIAGIVLALQQKKFSTATFEFGQLTEVTGIYQAFPVPSIKVMTKQDLFGRASFITVLLTGYGKFGAEGIVAELEKEKKVSLDKKQVTLKGTLLYNDGKTLLQVDRNDQPLIAVDKATETTAPIVKELGNVHLTGEVLDPKCYFGVMKPGHGKPHRDCAIRCIEGGMSPVFWVRDETGAAQYYLILDANRKKMNALLKDHIAEPVSLSARAVQYDDWTILYTDMTSIKRTGGLSWFKQNDNTIACGTRENSNR